MMYAIETAGLGQTFRDTPALDGVDLRIRQGSVFGLLGPNGAGKTTTIRILATLLRPDGGQALVLGHDVVREAARVREKLRIAHADQLARAQALVSRVLGNGLLPRL